MLPDWVAQREAHTLALCATDNAKNNLSIPALLLAYRTSSLLHTDISIQRDSSANVGDCNGNTNMVSNGFPSQESFKTYVNLCKPKQKHIFTIA